MSRQSPKPQLRLVEAPHAGTSTPPHDLVAEQSVVAAILLSAEDLGLALELLAPEDFYSPHGRLAMLAAVDLARLGMKVDLVTVAGWLQDSGKLQEAGGVDALKAIVDFTPHVHNVRAHATIVAEKAMVRRVIAEAQRIAAEGYGDVGDRRAWAEAVPGRLALAARVKAVVETVHVSSSVQDALAKVAARMDAPAGTLPGLSTGLHHLDDQSGGLHPGELTLVTAETGGGKSALAATIAVNVARQGRGVLVFSLEMPHDQYSKRMALAIGRVNGTKERKGALTIDEFTALVRAGQWLSQLPIKIIDDRKMTPAKHAAIVRREAKAFASRGTPIGLVIGDYLQKYHFPPEDAERNATRERLIGLGCDTMIEVTREVDVASLVLCQLNKGGEVRESSSALHNAEGWWNLKVAPSKTATPGVGYTPMLAEIEIKKQRHGERYGKAFAWFHGPFTLFTDDDRLDGDQHHDHRWGDR